MDPCLSIPFDQYQRYKLVSDIINKFRNKGESFRILEVGSGLEEILEKFLPLDDIYYLDKEIPEGYSHNEHIILGDILKTEFHENYDFVIAIDVYEHIPQICRKKFIDIIIPLSKIATIIAAPFDQDEVRKCEYFANEVYRNSHGSDYIWLKEHIKNGLPSLPAIQDMIKNHHLNFVTIPNGYLPRWFEMISAYLLTEGKPEFQTMMTTLFELYNQNFYKYDNKNPAYRHVVVIPKGEQKFDFSDFITREVEPPEFINKTILLESFIEKIKRAYLISEEGCRRDIAEINQKIIERNARIESLKQANTDKEIQIDQMSAQMRLMEQAITAKNTLLDQMSAQKEEMDIKQNRELEIVREQLNLSNQTITEKESEITHLNHMREQLKGENDSLKSSISYRLLTKIHTKIIEPLFPYPSKRRELYDLGLKGGRLIAGEGLKKGLSEYKHYRASKKNSSRASRTILKGQLITSKKDDPSCTPHEKALAHLHQQNSPRSTQYVPLSSEGVSLTKDDIKCIAFYLPQFHPIPENDKWWGKGFTEWTNVTKALPQFIGHYQPHLPDELGFYDLRLPEIQARQIELARHYGIYGFCFHYYWFNSKRLLERPLDQFIENKELNFPFCICWANENWTRRWDGMEQEVLISQTHSPENDIQFIRDIEDILRDPRYIRIDGKPLIIIYRVTLLPDAFETTRRWREFCRTAGIGEIYLVAPLVFGCEDPGKYGFDAAVEFPPHTMNECNSITENVQFFNPLFSGGVHDYEEFVKSKKYHKRYAFPCFRTVSPGWDNTPRRQNNASIFHGANPALYKQWLSEVAKTTKEIFPPDKQIVFINAWNEWAEGTHLEPDRRFGYGYLQATADTIKDLRNFVEFQKKKIIIVSHDAHLHGAQMLALHITRVLKEQFHFEVHLILKSGGVLEKDFEKYANVYNLERDYQDQLSVDKLLTSLRSEGISSAICNTVVSGDIVELLANKHIRALSLIHELPGVIQQYGQEENAKRIAFFADRVIFPAEVVKEKFTNLIAIDETKCSICPQGLFLKNKYKDNRKNAKKLVREILNLPSESKIILNVGYADSRKGIDLFVDVAANILKDHDDVWFVWVGLRDESLSGWIDSKIERSGLTGRILFPGIRRDDLDIFYSGADIFLLTSREDPFPSVLLDAMNARLPVVGFNDAGGFSEIVSDQTGILVPYLSVEIMSKEVTRLLNDPELQFRLGNNASDLIERKFSFPDYIFTLLGYLGFDYKKISVILPSYNYAHYLTGRIQSIFDQTYPVYEVIAIDDNSNDGSVNILRRLAEHAPVPVRVVENEKNSGSVFRQWTKGISLARGEYVWIAEADDLSETGFLEEVMKGFHDHAVTLSYSQSKQIDHEGKIISQDYCEYTDDVEYEKWKNDYSRPGIDEIQDSLSIKNTIPNVSAVIFRKRDISGIIEDLIHYKVAGDWFFYIWFLKEGSISYHARSLNLHRRHKKSVTTSENAQEHFNEIVMVQEYVKNNFNLTRSIEEKARFYREKVRGYLLK